MLVLVAHPYDPSIEATVSGPPYPFGDDLDLDGGMTFSLFGGETTVYMATDDYVTTPADTPANTYMPGVLLNGFSYQERMFEGTEPAGRTRPGFGNIVIANDAPRDGAGWLDDKLHLGWDGRDLLLYRGEKTAAFDTFELVARLTCDGLEWSESTVSLLIRNRQAAFDLPLVARAYGGTGGRDGGEDLIGRKVPQAYGYVFNVAPPLIDAANLVYQVHDRTTRDIGRYDVRDNGVELTADADYGSYEELIAAGIAPGAFGVCPAEGMVRLGASPGGLVTVTLSGDSTPPIGFADQLHEIIRVLVTQRMGDDSFADPADLDTAAFDDWDILTVCGYWTGTETTTAGEILDRLLSGVSGYWRVRLDGIFTFGRLTEPAGTAAHTIDARDIVAIARQNYVPSWSQTVTYRKNWTVQPGDGLAGSVTADLRQLYGAPNSAYVAEDSVVRAKHRRARAQEVDTHFDALYTGAAIDRQALYGTVRDIVEIQVVGDPFGFDIGDLVDVTGVTRFGWADPKKFWIIGRSVDDPQDGFRALITLTLWG